MPYLQSDSTSIHPGDTDIVREAREHMALVTTMEYDTREERKRCNKFANLQQWKDDVVTARGSRPTLTIDQLNTACDQTINDWRRNRLGIKISPGDAQGDEKFALLIEGDIRQAEYMSKAHIAYDWAFDCCVRLNAGFFQIYTKRRPGTFKQDFCIKSIENPDCVYMDPFCQEPDYSDQRVCLKTNKIGLQQYKDLYGETALTQDFVNYVQQQNLSSWIQKEAVLVGEYWRIRERPRQIMRLNKAATVIRAGKIIQTQDVYSNEWECERKGGEIQGTGEFQGLKVIRDGDGELMTDDEPIKEVWQYVVNGVEVLSKTRWAGSIIPIVPMLGRKMYLDGKMRLYSLISRSLDSQQLLNYVFSSMGERLGQFPKNPYLVLRGQVETDAQAWLQMNQTNYAFLQYDVVKLPDGSYFANPPQRNDADPRIDQFMSAIGLINQLQRGTTGIFGANLGDREGKVRSGAAEKALQQEGDNGTFDFLDNGGRALELGGKIIVDAWPQVRNQPDTITIRDHRNSVKSVRINETRDSMASRGAKVPEGQTRDYVVQPDILYHVAVGAAASNDTKRLQEADMAVQVYQELPPEQKTPQVTGELLRAQAAVNDSSVMSAMADAIDPPQQGQDIPPKVQKALQVSQRMIQELTGEVQRLNQEKQTEAQKNQFAWDRECLKAYVSIRTAEITASKDADKANADRTANFLEQSFEHAHEVGMQAMASGQAQALAAQQGQQDSQLSAQQSQQDQAAAAAEPDADDSQGDDGNTSTPSAGATHTFNPDTQEIAPV